jgi:SAM-dependent methyltransferase
MADWDGGYVTDVPYVADYHRETTPIWIATMATLLGHAAPDITRPFRYADLGSGNGVTPLIVAATMPHADVWAFDFNPNHIAAGRDIAHRAGLPNVRFIEASFEELARQPSQPSFRAAEPRFDFIVAHGVLSWISRGNQRHLFGVIGQRLAPGGIAYISYNVSTGWGGIRPVATLMRLLAEASPERTDRALANVFDTLDKMRDAGAALFAHHPALAARLAGFRSRNQSYVAHELLNDNWRPMMFQAVAAAMAGIKCDYLGGATPRANIEGLTVPAASHELFRRIRDPRLRETVRDLFAASPFRRDLYQRGSRSLTRLAHRRETDAIGLVRTFRPVPETIMLEAAGGEVTADQPRFHALLGLLEAGPATIGQLHADAAFAGWPDLALLEAVALLIGAGYLAPILTAPPAAEAIEATARLNRVHAALFERGEDRPYLASPVLGAAWPVSAIELLALDELRAGRTADDPRLADAVRDRVARSGRQLQRDGTPVVDPAAVRRMVADRVRDTLAHLPTLRFLGCASA